MRGNLRTNAAGANLNREWMTPSTRAQPGSAVRASNKIHETGVDMFFDIHGDEALPYDFVAGSEMLADFTPSAGRAQKAFIDAFKAASPDFQDVTAMPPASTHEEVLTLASKYIGHTFGCLSLTLEMPFKDNANAARPATPAGTARAARAGRGDAAADPASDPPLKK